MSMVNSLVMAVTSYVSSAISCGVWGKIWTLLCGTGLETVAVGFSVAGRYSGPRLWEGADGCESELILNVFYAESCLGEKEVQKRRTRGFCGLQLNHQA